MHGPYDDPYMFPSLNGGEPDDYDKHWRKVEEDRKIEKEKEERALYKRLKKKYEGPK